MDRRWKKRFEGMLAECEVSPRLWQDAEERLRQFVAPFTALLSQQAQRKRAAEYVAGLLTELRGGRALQRFQRIALNAQFVPVNYER